MEGGGCLCVFLGMYSIYLIWRVCMYVHLYIVGLNLEIGVWGQKMG